MSSGKLGQFYRRAMSMIKMLGNIMEKLKQLSLCLGSGVGDLVGLRSITVKVKDVAGFSGWTDSCKGK